MPKPRKMLGKADSPTCLAVMQLIETQSRTTLARWAIAYAEQTCLPLYEAAHPGEDALRNLAAACSAGPDAKAIKPQLRELAALARAETDPVAQAAAKAIATACAVWQTPTNALGFLFYAAAAIVYAREGTGYPPAYYDTPAEAAWQAALASLQAAALPNEPNPVKVNWNC